MAADDKCVEVSVPSEQVEGDVVDVTEAVINGDEACRRRFYRIREYGIPGENRQEL